MSSSTPSLNSSIRVRDGILFQELSGQGVLLNLGTGVYLGLDQVGTRVWSLLETSSLLSEIRDRIVSEFDVAPEQCAQDLIALITSMQENDLVTVTTPG